jgi:hypothetical protein
VGLEQGSRAPRSSAHGLAAGARIRPKTRARMAGRMGWNFEQGCRGWAGGTIKWPRKGGFDAVGGVGRTRRKGAMIREGRHSSSRTHTHTTVHANRFTLHAGRHAQAGIRAGRHGRSASPLSLFHECSMHSPRLPSPHPLTPPSPTGIRRARCACPTSCASRPPPSCETKWAAW